MRIIGIRGAITVNENSTVAIDAASYEMMKKIIELNSIVEDDVISITFTMTKDLNQRYPSVIVREKLNWKNTPILNFEEKDIIHSLEKCIRVLIYAYSDKAKKDVAHVYLKEAEKLRPDLCFK